jgi:murein DD-endopeptidase MepM/ murein hydrolase activator NlpD
MFSMNRGNHTTRKAVIIVYLFALHALTGFLIYREIRKRNDFPSSIPTLSDPLEASPVPTPIPVPSELADISTPESSPAVIENPNSNGLELTVPVKGIRLDQLTDTFNAARGQGRSHDAIDIMAAEGTPVVAAADGVIARFFDSVPGGTTIYQFTTDRKYMLYYAHLQKRAEGIKPGDPVVRGQLLGYVGDTGNAGRGNFHLHFSVAVVRDPARYWEGDYLNPFPLLRRTAP